MMKIVFLFLVALVCIDAASVNVTVSITPDNATSLSNVLGGIGGPVTAILKLSEDAPRLVLIMEAGPDEAPLSHGPVFYLDLLETSAEEYIFTIISIICVSLGTSADATVSAIRDIICDINTLTHRITDAVDDITSAIFNITGTGNALPNIVDNLTDLIDDVSDELNEFYQGVNGAILGTA